MSQKRATGRTVPLRRGVVDGPPLPVSEPSPREEWPEWMPPKMRNGVPGAGTVVAQLVEDRLELLKLEDRIRLRVDHARGLGASWGAVGRAMGMTAEGARSRYGRGRL